MMLQPYQSLVKTQCLRHPSLLNLEGFLSEPEIRHHTCRFVSLDFHHGATRPTTRAEFKLEHLLQEIREPVLSNTSDSKQCGREVAQGRILIIENITKDVVELLGSELSIDPLFFALHLHTARRIGMGSQPPDDANLPSRLFARDYVNLCYHRSVTSDIANGQRKRFLMNRAVDRKLIFLSYTNIGLAQHCASVMKLKLKSGFWLCLTLVDPDMGNTFYVDTRSMKGATKVHATTEPFLGSYEDFEGGSSVFTSEDEKSTSLGTGMISDLVRFWARGNPPSFDSKNPTIQSLAYYPVRIVAAEWVKYGAVMNYCLKRYEYHDDGDAKLDRFDHIIRELQSWRRRGMLARQRVQFIIRFLTSHDFAAVDLDSPWQHLIMDCEYIVSRIDDLASRLESMIPVNTSFIQIVDARRSFVETSNISRLTILALVFVPPTFISSLFSMNAANAPGSPYFWVYFAVAIPLTVFVFFVARFPVSAICRLLWVADSCESWFPKIR